MDEAEKALIKSNRARLVSDMRCDVVIDYLYQFDVLNDHHEDQIRKAQDASEKNRVLLAILITRPNSFQRFVDALKATTQYELASLLEPSNCSTPASHSAPTTQSSSTAAVGQLSENQILQKFERMTETQCKDALTKSLYAIQSDLVPTEVISLLESAKILRKLYSDTIRGQPSTFEQNGKLLDYVQKAGKRGFLEFVKALQTTDHRDLVAVIEQNVN